MVIAGLPIPILGVRGITVVEGTRGWKQREKKENIQVEEITQRVPIYIPQKVFKYENFYTFLTIMPN